MQLKNGDAENTAGVLRYALDVLLKLFRITVRARAYNELSRVVQLVHEISVRVERRIGKAHVAAARNAVYQIKFIPKRFEKTYFNWMNNISFMTRITASPCLAPTSKSLGSCAGVILTAPVPKSAST